ncbi:MAG: hypothetical protein K2P81_14920 [Bacteriovoracaceae bacterium]|nr:hypothetical protein [Bacteriovoracaceae bacterium]
MINSRQSLGKLFCLGCLILLASCAKKEPTYSKEDMLQMVPFEGPDKIEIVLAKTINDAIPCSDYGEGCVSAHRFKARGLNLIAVEFETPSHAEYAAKKIYGWTTRNWLLDDVDGEPELERWAVKYLNAKSFNPTKKEKAVDSKEKSSESETPSAPTSP